MDPSDLDLPVGSLTQELVRTALGVAGVRETNAAYASGLVRFTDGPGTIWLATDIGLVRADVDAGPEVIAEGQRARVTLDICPWVDVINPELVVEAIAMDLGRPSLLVTFKVQLPRIELTAGGEATAHSDASRLGRFAAAVLRERR